MGRRKNDFINNLKSMMWCRSVLKESGKSLYFLNRKYSEKAPNTSTDRRPKKWEKYNRGKTTPSRALVDEIAEAYPETLCWFDSPFWSIATDRELNEPEIKNWLQQNAPNVLSGLNFGSNGIVTNRLLPGIIDGLWKKAGLVELGALIALARLAIASRNGELYLDSLHSSLHVLIFNLSQTDLGLIREELFDYIKSRFLSEPLNNEILYEDCTNIALYTQSLNDSLNVLIDHKIINNDLRSKAKANFFFWRDRITNDCRTGLCFEEREQLAQTLDGLNKSLSEDGRSRRRNHMHFRILKVRALLKHRQHNAGLNSAKELISWKLEMQKTTT